MLLQIVSANFNDISIKKWLNNAIKNPQQHKILIFIKCFIKPVEHKTEYYEYINYTYLCLAKYNNINEQLPLQNYISLSEKKR